MFQLYFIVCFVSFGNLGLSQQAIGGITTGASVGAVLLLLLVCCICGAIRGILQRRAVRPTYLPNAAYVKGEGPVQSPMDGNVFKSGGFISHSPQNGPGEMKLAFSPQGGHTVSGEGTDSLGAYVVKGHYSSDTLAMDFEKQYRTGTGDPFKNTGQTVKVNLQWNPTSQQFEEKRNVWSRLRKNQDQLIIAPLAGQYRRPFYVQSSV